MSLFDKPRRSLLVGLAGTAAIAIVLVGVLAHGVQSGQGAHAAATGNDYPWQNASCVTPNPNTGQCSGDVAYDTWGYQTCPSNDTNCTRGQPYITPSGVQYGVYDPWGMNLRNCTSAVAWWLHERNGFDMPFHDDAAGWGADAANRGYAVNMHPVVGAVAWWQSIDHVAWVESVSANGTSVTVEEYNDNLDGTYQSPPRTIPVGSVSGYIHFKDLQTSGGGATPGLGGGAASSWSSGRLDAWIEQATPTNGSNLGHLWYDLSSGWHPWETIPGNRLLASQPAAVSWGVNRIDVFARGQAGDLIHEWYDHGTWYGWESLGGCIMGAPTVTSWGTGRLDVLVEGCNPTGPNLYHLWYDGSWHPWELVAANRAMTAPPAAVSWAPGRIDVFSRGSDASLIHTWYDGNGWHAWESLGGCIVGSPAASSWAAGRLDGWVEGCNETGANFYHIWYDGNWHPFEVIPASTPIAGVLGVVSWGYGRIDMFTRSADNTLAHWWYDGAWHGPESMGGAIAAA